MTLTRTMSARVANQQFASLLRDVEAGGEVVVTRRGVPVARMTPVAQDGTRRLTAEQERARTRTRVRLREGWPLGGGAVDRDSLYDRR